MRLFDKRRSRRASAIHAYVGSNGGGKTLAMIHDTLPSLREGRPCLSTVRLLDPGVQADCEEHAREEWARLGLDNGDHVDPLGLPHPQYVPLKGWGQLLDFRYGDMLLDEVLGVANSRQSQSMPPAIMNQIHQMRRADVLVRWTSPSYARADVSLREVTQAVTHCRGFLSEPAFTADGTRRMWGAKRLFNWRTYDAEAFDEFSAGKREQLRPMIRSWLWRKRDGDRTTGWYDTFASVDYIVDATETGSCLRCGGHRRRPSCSCADSGPARKRSADGTAPVQLSNAS